MPKEEQQEERGFFVHLAMRSGYTAVVPMTRLPKPDEDLEEWLHEECDFARVGGRDSGALYLSGIDDLLMVAFHREPVPEPEPEPLPDKPEGLPIKGWPPGPGEMVVFGKSFLYRTVEEKDEEEQDEEDGEVDA